MEQTTRLKLYKLANGDYANKWEVPTNANVQAVEDEAVALATELLTDPTEEYSGQLGRSCGSLEERLDLAMDDYGAIVYNDGDLDKSCHQQDGFETTAIHDRFSNIDRREFVNARLRYLQRTTAFAGEFLKKRESYGGLTGVEKNRYMEEFGQESGSRLFCYLDGSSNPTMNDPVMTGGGVMEIKPMGWCSISGKLYYHKNTSYYTFGASGQLILYLAQAPISGGDFSGIDNRLIRSYSNGTTGQMMSGSSIFTSVGIGIISSVSENNNWKPEVFQILRVKVSDAPVYKEYLIKAVTDNNIEIYGEFADTLVGINWWVLDYTIPCVNFSQYTHTPDALREIMNIKYLYNNWLLSTHGVTYNSTTTAFYAARIANVFNYQQADPKCLFFDMSNKALVPTENYFEQSLGELSTGFNIAPYNIKCMSVLCMEKWSNNTNKTIFTFAINPSQASGADGFLPVIYPEIIRTMTMNGIDQIQKTWFDAPLVPAGGGDPAVQTSLRVHCNSTKEAAPWTITTDSYVFCGRVWWGVLIEYA